MERDKVVQGVLDLFEQPSYLEVGVFEGVTFHAVAAARKVAVDPAFKFDHRAAAAAHPECTYRLMPSDRYFGEHAAGEGFDVAYLDGLHTFEQTLRDLINTLAVIRPDGIIVVDDILPSSLAAALPDRAEYKLVRRASGVKEHYWMGDVYKLVLFVETFFQSWSYACVAENHGQLVMWQSPRPSVRERRVEAIGLAGYERTMIERDAFRFMPFAAIIAEIKAARARSCRPATAAL